MNAAGHRPVVAVAEGELRGTFDEGSHAFFGVPYAAPPVGALRFAAPQPVVPWGGVRDAGRFGPTPPQPAHASLIDLNPPVAGDDYLNLNIWTPADRRGPLPVIVYLPGGAYMTGGPSGVWYKGSRFARDGVILVTVGHRLGAEGFLHMEGAPDNRAVLDWIAALRWVKTNIGAFGGDTANITLAGQSSGACAVSTLMVSPMARGLFDKLVLMSSATRSGMPVARSEATARAMAAFLGVTPDRAGFASVPTEAFIEAQVRAGSGVPADTAAGVIDRVRHGLPFQPVADGELVPHDLWAAVAGGAGAGMPLLLTTAEDEFDYRLPADPDAVTADVVAARLAEMGLGDAAVREHLAAYAHFAPARQLSRAYTDHSFRASAGRLAELRRTAPAPTYLAEFRWKPSDTAAAAYGTLHAMDLPFVFDALDAPGVTQMAGAGAPRDLASQMHGAMVDFARSGAVGWAPYSAGRAAHIFDVPTAEATDPLASVRDRWTPLLR